MAGKHGRRRRSLYVFGALLLIIAAGGWLGVRGLAAQRHLEQARTELTAARAALTDRQVEPARAAVLAAGRETERARELTGDPVWRLAAAIPYAGASLEVGRAVAVAADDIARRVLPGALTAVETVDADSLRRPDGGVELTLLQAAQPPLTASAATFDAVSAELTRSPRAGVVGPVARARDQFVSQLDELGGPLRDGARALELAVPLLGGDRPRRFFVLVQQTSEARGTGGLVGGYAVIETDRGRVRVSARGSNADLQSARVPVPPGVGPDFVRLYGGGVGAFELWGTINLSPDLPTVARVVNAKWQAQGGGPLDGVIALDAKALAFLLRDGGDIEVADGRRIPPEGLEDYLAVGQYVGVVGEDGRSERKDQLEVVAGAVTDRIVSGDGSLEPLLRGLAEAVRSGHLRMASDDPALAPLLADAGVDGGLPQGPAPVAYPVLVNATGGKLDNFLQRSVTYVAGPCEGSRRRSTVSVELRNEAPADGLPPFLTIRNTGDGITSSTDSTVSLIVYTTPGAELVRATVDGRAVRPQDPDGLFVANSIERGLPLFQVMLDLPRDQTRRFVLELDEPVVAGAARVPEQPLSRPLARDVRVPAC